MRVRLVVPDGDVSPDLIEPALEAVTRTNLRHMRAGTLISPGEAIRRGARWKPEPPGDEHFDLGRTIVSRGWGDCDDWAPYKAAHLRHTGEDPGARAIITKTGPKRWHSVVERSDGSIDDPSRDAGMGRNRVSGAYVPGTRSVACLGLSGRRWRNGYTARTELRLPGREHGLAVHVVGQGRGPAIEACHGASVLADVVGERDAVRKYRALRDMIAGVPVDLVSERYSVDGGSLFSSLTAPFRAAVAPIQSAAASAVRAAASPLSQAFAPVSSLIKAADPLGITSYAGRTLSQLAPLAAYAPIPGAAAFGPIAAAWTAAALQSGDPFGSVPVSAIESGALSRAIMQSYAPGADAMLQRGGAY